MPDVPRALNPARLTPIAAALLALSAPAFAAIPADHRHDHAHDDETVETLDAVEVNSHAFEDEEPSHLADDDR